MKDYLIQVLQKHSKFLRSLKKGDIIQFEMPPFCSGDYEAKVRKDKNGLYIYKEDNYFNGCRDFNKKRKKVKL